jgi:flagellar basal-body rod modification protein FlgD
MSMVNPVASAQPPTPSLYASQPTSAPQQTLTAADFMQLLVTQLQNQDPSQPMDSAAMVQQTTELGMMQEMSSVQTNTSSSVTLQMQTVAADLIGKAIGYIDDAGNSNSGVVTGVSFSGSVPTVSVNGSTVNLSDISSVNQQPAS